MQEFLASTNFTVIFISLIGIKFLLETYLKIRNLKSIELNKNAIPERFVSVVTEDEYKKSIDYNVCLLYTSPSPRDMRRSRMPSSA